MDIKKQEEYLMILAGELKYLKKKDAEKVLTYYQNRINIALDYGEKEEDILKSLPSPEEAAESAYESHGLKYKEMQMRKHKAKHNFQLGFNGLVCFLIGLAFIGVLILSFFLTKNNLMFIGKVFSLNGLMNIILCFILSISYILVLFTAFIYIIDLFYIVFMQFFGIYIKDADKKKKLLSFTISGKIGELVHYNKAVSRFLLGSFFVTIIFMCASYFTKGYVYASLQDKPSIKETIELDSFDKIDITSKNASINLKKGDRFYAEYFYELNHDLKFNIVDNTLKLDIEASKSYDLFNLLKEPTQIINIYIPSLISEASFNISQGMVQFEEVNLTSVNLKGEVKGIFTFKDSSINDVNIDSYELNLGINHSNIDNLTVKEQTGQFIIEEASNILNLNLTNSQGTVNFKDSKILNLTITNKSGLLNLDKLTGDILDLKTKSNQSYIKNSVFRIIKTENYVTSSLNLERVVATESITSKVDSSYYTFDFVKCPSIKIDGNMSFIFINGIGKKSELNTVYNDYDINSNLEVFNQGANSKIQIGTSTLDYCSIVQKEGFILLTDSSFTKSKVVSEGVRIFEITKFKTKLMDLYLTKTESMIVNIDDVNDMFVSCKKIDASSRANMRIPKDFRWEIIEEPKNN